MPVGVEAAASEDSVATSVSKRPQQEKVTPSDSRANTSAADMEMEEEWSNDPHRDTSDYEDWPEDDAASGSSVSTRDVSLSEDKVSPSNHEAWNKDGDEEERVIMPLILTPKKEVTDSPGGLQGKKTKVGKDLKHFHRTLSSQSNGDEEGDQYKPGDIGTTSSERRKYRKRPASSSVFTCPHCPYKSNRHFNVQRHEKLAHSSKKPEYQCKDCGTSYSLAYRLKLHIRSVHLGEGHHCHVCNRSFETATGLKSHIEKKHEQEETKEPQEPPPELTCQLCGRFFSSKSHLARHMATHVMVQPYRCYMCNAAFCEETEWLSHQQACSQPFTIMCCLCSQVLASPQELLGHMDRAHGRAEYSCLCGKTFPWKKSLMTHQQKCTLTLTGRQSAGLTAGRPGVGVEV